MWPLSALHSKFPVLCLLCIEVATIVAAALDPSVDADGSTIEAGEWAVPPLFRSMHGNIRRHLADEIVQTDRPMGLGTGLFAIFIFVLIFFVMAVAGIFVEKLRGALIGGGLCMLVTVTLFVTLAPRGPKYQEDYVEEEDGEYNVLGRVQPFLFVWLFLGLAAGGFGMFKFFLAEDMTASRHLRR